MIRAGRLVGAYNNIVMPFARPACDGELDLCQTYVAASFQGDETASFSDGIYAIGDRLRWWPETDPRYPEWRAGGMKERERLPENTDLDAGYVDCTRCKSEYFAVIRFIDCTVISIDAFGPVAAWPEGFLK